MVEVEEKMMLTSPSHGRVCACEKLCSQLQLIAPLPMRNSLPMAYC